ncbi:hypothetical protein Tco_1389235 [Tanacetum coccineum]
MLYTLSLSNSGHLLRRAPAVAGHHTPPPENFSGGLFRPTPKTLLITGSIRSPHPLSSTRLPPPPPVSAAAATLIITSSSSSLHHHNNLVTTIPAATYHHRGCYIHSRPPTPSPPLRRCPTTACHHKSAAGVWFS